jgi:hypothetical protein
MQDTKLVVARSYASRPEADLAKGALEDAGILAMIQADTAGGMREHLAWSGAGFEILVREEDATAAREVLAPPTESAENPDPESGASPGLEGGVSRDYIGVTCWSIYNDNA